MREMGITELKITLTLEHSSKAVTKNLTIQKNKEIRHKQAAQRKRNAVFERYSTPFTDKK
jgi:hypothetical protein